MLYEYVRVFRGDNGTLSDLSLINQDKTVNVPLDIVAAEDYIYVAQNYAFNNLFFQVSTANDVAATINFEYWDGKAWREVVDILDGTSTAGVTMAKSGVVQFVPNDRFSWNRMGYTDRGSHPAELDDITLYDMYWLRISFSADLNAATELRRMTYSFSANQKIEEYDITLKDYITEFQDESESSKTNWDDEIITASELVVADMKNRSVIVNRGQVLRFDDVFLPTTYKTLELIYSNLRGDFKEKLSDVRAAYKTAFPARFTFDRKGDGRVTMQELNNSVIKMVR